MSVRAPPGSNPLVVFGKDEVRSIQFLFGMNQCVYPEGKHALLSNTDVIYLMISAFKSGEFGWGYDITEDNLKGVNEKSSDKFYKDR